MQNCGISGENVAREVLMLKCSETAAACTHTCACSILMNSSASHRAMLAYAEAQRSGLPECKPPRQSVMQRGRQFCQCVCLTV